METEKVSGNEWEATGLIGKVLILGGNKNENHNKR